MRHQPARPLAIRRALTRAAALLIAAVAVLSFAIDGAIAATSAAAQAPARSVMILLDINSSQGWLAKAQQGAVSYLRALPSDVHAGLITFSNSHSYKLWLTPKPDRKAVIAAVNNMAPGGPNSTGLEAALTGLSTVAGFGGQGSRALVITNAKGLPGTVSLNALVPVDVLMPEAIGAAQPANLSQLASSSGGTLSQPQLTPTKHPPSGPCKFPKVCRAAQELASAVFPKLGAVHKPAPHKAPKPAGIVLGRQSSAALIGGIAGVFAALFIVTMLVFGAMARTGKDRSLSGRIEKYGPRHKPARAKEPEDNDGSKVESAAVGAVTRIVSSGAQDKLAKRLDLAGVARKPAEWILLAACLGVVVAATLSLVTSYVLLGVVAGVVISWLSMRLSLSLRILRRRARFADQLPDLLQLIASALKSGFSLPQALDAVVTEGNQPAAGEFSRALAEVRVGINLEDALEAVATRMDSDDLRWTVMAIRIQQGVGGNLAEVLLTIAGTIRERAFLRRQVQALSAEGRLSAYVLVALPLLVGAWLFISSPNYMRPLYSTGTGKLMLAAAGSLLIIGAVWMRRTIKVKV